MPLTNIRPCILGISAFSNTLRCFSVNTTRSPLRRFLVRQYTTKFPDGKHGPKKTKLKAIPFTKTKQEALEAFSRHHGKSWLSAGHIDPDKMDARYVPFWVGSTSVISNIVSAQVGYNQTVTRYNRATKRNETTIETRWAWIDRQFTLEGKYASSDPQMQIYGAYKYKKGYINPIKGGENVMEQVRDFDPTLLTLPDQTEVSHIDMFNIKPNIAVETIRRYVNFQEERQAEQFLMQTYRADNVRLLHIEVELVDLLVSPVYFPVYVAKKEYLGTKFRTFIHGVTLKTGGQLFYSPEKTSLLTGVSTTLLLFASGYFQEHSFASLVWLGVIAPTIMVGVATLYYPLLSNKVRQEWGSWEQKKNEQVEQESWDYEWVRGYDEYHQKQEQTYRQSYENRSQTKQGSDPLGYYDTLGVKPNASKEDIQSAFRMLAMKSHPDRFPDPKEKAIHQRKFQKISEAYTVLRDPTKRKRYDVTGTS